MLANNASNVVLLSSPNSILNEVKEIRKQDSNVKLLDIHKFDTSMEPGDASTAVLVADLTKVDDRMQKSLLQIYQQHAANFPEIVLIYNKDRQSILLPEILEKATTLVGPDQDPNKLIELVDKLKSEHDEKIASHNDLKGALATISLMKSAEFKIKSLDEARSLSILLASLSPESTELAMGLSELIVNAIEHGNLGITFEEKGELLVAGKWRDEIEKRLKLPEFSHKQVTITVTKTDQELCFVISDEGDGFDVTDYLSNDQSSNLPGVHFHGRGIRLAQQLSFSELEYTGSGNTVVARVLFEPPQAT